MKMIRYRPENFLSPSSGSGRVGSFVTSSDPADLPHLKPGIVVVGLACDAGVKNVGGRLGAARGPEAFRKKFYRLASPEPPLPVVDLGDIPSAGTPQQTHALARALLLGVRKAGHTPLVIGGGHDLAYAEAASLLDFLGGKPAGFLNVDAHLDLRNTHNGITSGSPWYLLAESPEFRKSRSRLHEFGIQPHANAEELFAYAKRRKIPVDLLENLAAPETAFQRRLAALGRTGPVQVSLDIDSVRWSDAPGVSAPQNTGFTAEEAISFSRTAGTHASVRSFGIYELCPPHDRDDQTAALVARCALAFLGGFATRRRRG
ncbi:MAG: formimidoylglutamase [Bdellovibrionales bacterium]|nr:formimidoylglutamase [Bdellovibrionales bacterium]